MVHRLFGAVVAFVAGLGLTTAQAEISTSANHALLMDGESGEILWQKDARVTIQQIGRDDGSLI
jgi:D-alanyl-D-alanine carboxypeptidase